MGKTVTLNLRVDPDVKKRAESVLRELGIPMSTAINIYLKQICLTGGIPFEIKIPNGAPEHLRADDFTAEQIREKLESGYADIEKGHMHNAKEAFEKFKKR